MIMTWIQDCGLLQGSFTALKLLCFHFFPPFWACIRNSFWAFEFWKCATNTKFGIFQASPQFPGRKRSVGMGLGRWTWNVSRVILRTHSLEPLKILRNGMFPKEGLPSFLSNCAPSKYVGVFDKNKSAGSLRILFSLKDLGIITFVIMCFT